LLSAILTRATGTSALAFAESHLFPHLGIAKARWKANQGVNLGGTGLHMRTIDMAMLGYLYLNDGQIGDEQVISRAWVRESTRMHAQGHPEWFGGYGFHWWVSPQAHNRREDMFFALGQHGQYIFVAPAKKLVAAFRKKPGKKEGVMLPKTIFLDHVLPCF
jgi:CubicO group peptidase (beta-lactamase class C family)